MAVAMLLRLQDDNSPPVPLQNKITVWFLFCLIYACVTLEPSDSIANNDILTDGKVSPCPFLRPQLLTGGIPNLPSSSAVILGATTKILANIFWINFNHLCCWLKCLFLHFYCGSSPTQFSTHSSDIWSDVHLPFHAGFKSSQQPVMDQPPDWVTCWGLRRWHLSSPAYATGLAGPNSTAVLASTKGRQKLNDCFIHCPNRFSSQEGHA